MKLNGRRRRIMDVLLEEGAATVEAPGEGTSVWVGASWNMNKTLAESLSFANALAAFAPDNCVQSGVAGDRDIMISTTASSLS
ncbi:MAG TPA: hypothetical protein VES39_12165 [Rhodospirillales bacterium]|nr:hypothetical protein [Rhodospirillales bacterium]